MKSCAQSKHNPLTFSAWRLGQPKIILYRNVMPHVPGTLPRNSQYYQLYISKHWGSPYTHTHTHSTQEGHKSQILSFKNSMKRSNTVFYPFTHEHCEVIVAWRAWSAEHLKGFYSTQAPALLSTYFACKRLGPKKWVPVFWIVISPQSLPTDRVSKTEITWPCCIISPTTLLHHISHFRYGQSAAGFFRLVVNIHHRLHAGH